MNTEKLVNCMNEDDKWSLPVTEKWVSDLNMLVTF